MKKVIIAICCLLVIGGFAILPWIGGKVTENVIRKGVSKANTLYANSGQVHSEIKEYKRGYSSSTLITEYAFPLCKDMFGEDTVIVETNVSHGVTGIEAISNLKKNKWYDNFITKVMGGDDPLHITTKYGYLGSVTGSLQLDACRFMPKSGSPKRVDKIDANVNTKLVIEPAEITVSTDKNFRSYDATGRFGGITFQDGSDSMVVYPGALNVSAAMLSKYFWTGESELSLEKIEFKDKRQYCVAIEPTITGKNRANDDNTLLSTESSISVKKIQIGNDSVSDIRGTIAFNNINLERFEHFMEKYVAILKRLSENLELETGGNFDKKMEQQIQLAFMQIFPELEKLLTKDLELHIRDIHCTTPEGEISGDVRLQLKDNISLTQFLPLLMGNPQALFDMFELESSLRLPKKISNAMMFMPISTLSPHISSTSNAPLFVQDGEYNLHHAKTGDGRLYLNDVEVSFR